MKAHLERKRFLVEFDSHSFPHIFTDVLVIGSGVAGLCAAIEAGHSREVLVITKNATREGSTDHAQGGVAVALNKDDTPEEHIEDTMHAGHGLCDPDVVKLVVDEGPGCIRELIKLGAQFDSENGHLSFAREGGHSKARVVHAHGDATGAEVERTLISAARSMKNIQIQEHVFVLDLLTSEGNCHGAVLWHEKRGILLAWARRTILASGGAGQVYRETTNPDVSTGDGMAMAYRAGAALQGMEFMQFHPTTLYIAGASRALVTEAVRGEGAIVRNRRGERFMGKYHEALELAPRDVMSRSILKEITATGDTNAYLDLTHLPADSIRKRFPGLAELCKSFDIDITSDYIPIRPSAHYMIGGIMADSEGRASIQHLYAVGEVASSGLHGANRLGSNSLLEGLVFGKRAGAHASKSIRHAQRPPVPHNISSKLHPPRVEDLNILDVRNSLKSLMWRNVGIERDAARLADASDHIDTWCSYVMDKQFDLPQGWELQNMLTLSKAMAVSALRREETRGVHHRVDFPETDDKNWKRQITIQNESALI